MKLVVVESPYAGDIELNEGFARLCMRDCILRGEAPIASHLLYTQPRVLEEEIPTERSLGIVMGYLWGMNADKVVFYIDIGMSSGMNAAWAFYNKHKVETEQRYLNEPEPKKSGCSCC
jgi:hypothetical protein